jgi:hypothetical protein
VIASHNVDGVPSRRVNWRQTFRLVPSRFPPIDLFERVSTSADWQLLYELEGITNPRLRDEVGNIQLVPPERRVSGPNASIVMAPFTHCSKLRPSRFTDGSFGVYYAGHTFKTALLEVAYHMGRFHAATRDPAINGTYRTYKGSIRSDMHDLGGAEYAHFLRPDPATYDGSQKFAKALREANSNGLVYPSVRHRGGECIAAFWPNVVSLPTQGPHVELQWDGRTISGWFEHNAHHASGPPTWLPLPS